MPHKDAQRPISKVVLDSVRLLTNTITTSNQGQNVFIYDQFCLVLPYPVNAELEAKVYESVTKGSFAEEETTECSTEVASHWDALLVAMEKALGRPSGCDLVGLLAVYACVLCWVLGDLTKVTDREWESKARVQGCWVPKPAPAAAAGTRDRRTPRELERFTPSTFHTSTHPFVCWDRVCVFNKFPVCF